MFVFYNTPRVYNATTKTNCYCDTMCPKKKNGTTIWLDHVGLMEGKTLEKITYGLYSSNSLLGFNIDTPHLVRTFVQTELYIEKSLLNKQTTTTMLIILNCTWEKRIK